MSDTFKRIKEEMNRKSSENIDMSEISKIEDNYENKYIDLLNNEEVIPDEGSNLKEQNKKMKELFEKMVNITYQAQAQGEIGMVTGDRIDKVVKEYEEYCNREEREKLVLEAKDILDEVHKDLSTKNLETVNNLIDIGDKINKVDEYLDEIQKYNVVCKE